MFGKRNWGGCGSMAADVGWARSIRQEMQAMISKRRHAWKDIISVNGGTSAVDIRSVASSRVLSGILDWRVELEAYLIRTENSRD